MTTYPPWTPIKPYPKNVGLPITSDTSALLAVGEDERQKEAQKWVEWTNIFLAISSLVMPFYYGIIEDKPKIEEPWKTRILATLYTFNEALIGVNDAFNGAIDDINAGYKPGTQIKPAPIPDWPEEGGQTQTLTWFRSVWSIARPILQSALGYWQSHSDDAPQKVIVALEGLLNVSDILIDELAEAF
ncbi:MAG: hypothetical protein HQL69_22330 [Magnetococcales bacterium]|nr:hypothetical protein [Magnetococcales bacterium]